MSLNLYINFRSSAAYVTDGANQTYCADDGASNYTYPQTRGGSTFGFTGSTVGIQFRDRNNAIDVRLAGIVFCTSPAQLTFQWDLDAANAKNVHYGGGDPSGGQATYAALKDNATTFTTVNDSSIAGGSVVDAAGVEYTDANWPASETAVARTFGSTTFNMVMGSGLSDGRNNMVQTLGAVDAGGGGGGTTKRLTTLGVGNVFLFSFGALEWLRHRKNALRNLRKAFERHRKN